MSCSGIGVDGRGLGGGVGASGVVEGVAGGRRGPLEGGSSACYKGSVCFVLC